MLDDLKNDGDHDSTRGLFRCFNEMERELFLLLGLAGAERKW